MFATYIFCNKYVILREISMYALLGKKKVSYVQNQHRIARAFRMFNFILTNSTKILGLQQSLYK